MKCEICKKDMDEANVPQSDTRGRIMCEDCIQKHTEACMGNNYCGANITNEDVEKFHMWNSYTKDEELIVLCQDCQDDYKKDKVQHFCI